MPDFVVYSTSNTAYQRWQCDLLEFSYANVRQPGRLICLCSEGENNDLSPRTSDIAEVVQLPSYMKNPVTGDFWGIANKIMSLKAWIADESLDGSVLFLDPDMIFVSPVDISVSEGQVIGQRWVDPGVAGSPTIERFCAGNLDRITPETVFMYPYVMHTSDIRRMMARYEELAFGIRAAEKRWESDMFALVIVAAEYGLDVITRDDIGVCNNWKRFNEAPSSIVHFPGPFIAADGEKIWFKQDFTKNTLTKPWEKVPRADRADCRAEYVLLSTLARLVNRQKIEARGLDFLYWKALAADNCLQDYRPEPNRYVIFDQYRGGFNNIRMSLEIAAAFAWLLNRTLVIPPRTSFYLLEGECGFDDFFDLEDLGIETLSFEAWCAARNIDTARPLEQIWAEVGEKTRVVDDDVIQKMVVLPVEDLSGQYADLYRGSRDVLRLTDEMLQSETLYFPRNLLGNFYLNIYPGGRLAALTRYMARHVHYREELFLEAYKLIDHMGDGAYAAMHIRRNDFQYKNLFISGVTIYDNVKGILSEGERLYIATDAVDTEFLAGLEAHYEVTYFKDIAHLSDKYLDKNLIGCIEQLICTRARVFIGNRLSTLSSYVYRLRGYMNDVYEDNYYDNTRVCRLPILESGPAVRPSWAGRWDSSWGREYPEVWAYRNEKIFVSIASYRDPDVTNTIADILEMADDADNVVLGVCLQDTEEALASFPYRDHPNIRLLAVNYMDTHGVSYARSRIQEELYQDEKYYLQIDSHSRFSKGWDTYLKAALASCKVAKPILSTYPNPFEADDEDKRYLKEVKSNGIVYQRFDDNGHLQVRGARIIESDVPVPGVWIGAGFVFAYGRWIDEVPYDRDIYFKGEEDSLHLRSYTHGWDVFIPPLNVVYHDYNDNRLQSPTKVRPLHWEDHKGTSPRLDVVSKLYEGEGLGPVRTLKSFERNFGLDLENREIKPWGLQGYPLGYYTENVEGNLVSIELDSGAIPQGDYSFWIFCLFNANDKEVFRRDFVEKEIISGKTSRVELFLESAVYEMELTKALLWPAWGPGDFAPRHEYEIEIDVSAGVIRPRTNHRISLDLSGARWPESLVAIIVSFVDDQDNEIYVEKIVDDEILDNPGLYSIDKPWELSKATEYVVYPLLETGTFLPPTHHVIHHF